MSTKITGWATVNRSTFDWPDGAVPLFINQIGYENVAQCPDACSRFLRYHDGQSTEGYDYPGCSGGAANRFDMHLWLTEGMGFGGAGGDWGQRLDRAYFMDGVDAAHQHIWLHEFGHGFGFPDCYNWDVWAPGVATAAGGDGGRRCFAGHRLGRLDAPAHLVESQVALAVAVALSSGPCRIAPSSIA